MKAIKRFAMLLAVLSPFLLNVSLLTPPATEQHHPFGCFYKTEEGCPFYWTGYVLYYY